MSFLDVLFGGGDGGDTGGSNPFGDVFGDSGTTTPDLFGGTPDISGVTGATDPSSFFGGANPLSDPGSPIFSPNSDPNAGWTTITPQSLPIGTPVGTVGGPPMVTGPDGTLYTNTTPAYTLDPAALSAFNSSLTAGTPGTPWQIPSALWQALQGHTSPGNTVITGPSGSTQVPNPSGGDGGGSNNTGGGGGSGGGSGGNTGGIPNSLINLLGGVAGLGALGGLFGSPSLGSAGTSLQNMANTNQALVNNTILPTALANEQGQISAPALNSIDRALQEKEASIRQSYAQMGMSGSTMEAQDLAGARDASEQQVFSVGQTMAQTGLQAAASLNSVDASAYGEIMQEQIAQDKDLSDAIAAFAGAVTK